MSITELSIRRPVFTLVVSLMMAIIGLVSFHELAIRWVPNVAIPELTIETNYPGSNAIVIDELITKPIEDSLAGLNGVDSIQSESRFGVSQIHLSFKLGQNMDSAVQTVRGYLEKVRGNLPQDASTPTILLANSQNEPILYVAYFDATRSKQELTDYINHFIVPKLETIEGVGAVSIFGDEKANIQITLDSNKLAATQSTVDDVYQAVRNDNQLLASGELKARDRRFSILLDSKSKSIESIKQIVVKRLNQSAIKLEDLGTVLLSSDNNTLFRVNGKNGIAIGIIPQSTANPLDVERSVSVAISSIAKGLPNTMHSDVVYNEVNYIRASIDSVYESLFEAIIFVGCIIALFIGGFRYAIIPMITIPFCLLGTFSILYMLGFSINTITLMAFVLAIGLVVDDAIVMLENIMRHIESGMPVYDAALKGSREMIFPVIAMTTTLSAVYAPIAFTPGMLGVLFREFTLTLAGSVILSGFVALTLTPMMCSRYLKSKKASVHADVVKKTWLDGLSNRYEIWLLRLLSSQKKVFACIAFVCLLGAYFYYALPAELAPSEDMSMLYAAIMAPKNASIDYLNDNLKQVESAYAKYPDVKGFLTFAEGSSSHAFQLLLLQNKENRKYPVNELIDHLTREMNQIAGVKVSIFQPPPPIAEMAGDDSGSRLVIVAKTSSDYAALEREVSQFVKTLEDNPSFAYVNHQLKSEDEQYQVTLDKDRVSDLNIPIETVSNTLSALFSDTRLGKVDDRDIMLRLNDHQSADSSFLNNIYVRSLNGQMSSLSLFTQISLKNVPRSYSRTDRMRSDRIFITPEPGIDMTAAMQSIQHVINSGSYSNLKFDFAGEAKSFLDSNGTMLLTFLLSLLFIYLVLSAQFENMVDPFVILLSVPFSIIGALGTLYLFGGTLNIYSEIGMITLIGLIAKHGILITEFANHMRSQGMDVERAVIEASLQRLRPILMTAFSMILGALPLAMALGAGSENRHQIGLVIVGGLLFGTVFSLFIIPLFYVLLSPYRIFSFGSEVRSSSDAVSL